MTASGPTIAVLSHAGRLSPRVAEELRTLTDEGGDVTVYFWQRGDRARGATDPDWAEQRLGTLAPVGRLAAAAFLPWLYLRLLAALWHRDADVVHLTHLSLLPLAPPLRYVLGAAVVYDCYEFHALDVALRAPSPLQDGVERVVAGLEDSLVRTVDCVLTVDSVEDQLAARFRQTCDDVAVLYNVPNLSCGDPAVAEMAGGDGCPHRLVYVGGISAEKGAIKAVEALGRLRDRGVPATLEFVGTVQDGTPLEAEVKRRGLGDVVSHIEWLPYGEMLVEIADADVGLALHQPSERFRRVSTGNGRKFFTYMQVRLPVLGSTFGDVGAVIRETECGRLVDTTDETAIADEIGTLLGDESLRRSMGARGRQAVEDRYNWDNEKRKLITAYPRVGRNE